MVNSPASSDSLWSDYYVDAVFAQDEYDRKQSELENAVPKLIQRLLRQRRKEHGDYSFWAKHGLFRAYFSDGTFYELNPSFLRGTSHEQG